MRYLWQTRLHRDINRQSIRMFQEYLEQSANEYTCMSALFLLH